MKSNQNDTSQYASEPDYADLVFNWLKDMIWIDGMRLCQRR